MLASAGPAPRRWRARALALALAATLPVGAAIAATAVSSVDVAAVAAIAAPATATTTATADSDDIGARLAAPPAIIDLVDSGDFIGAEAAIARALEDASLNADQRTALEFQRERMRRILLDFRLDEAGAKARLRRDIPDLTDAEFARWDAEGLIEARVIDGQRRWFSRGPSNLFRLSEEARKRRATPLVFYDSPLEVAHPQHARVREAALASGESAVAPQRVRVTQSLTVKPDAVPAGETVRAWLPFPRAIAGQQEHIALQSTVPAAHRLAPESAMQRTVYMEAPAVAGEPTAFSVTYELTVHAQYHRIDPERVVPAEITPELAPFVAERAPHVVFNDAMRLESARIVGDETNPYRIAQKLFAAVDRIPWAGAREYSTITNIGQHALEQGHADCGQQTLLLITLLRMNGIPARWQSGWIFSDGEYNNMHDWGWMYLAPYGWVPMDVTFGRLPGAAPELQDFYLGGLDAWRIAFNDDWSREFVPAKRHPRSETVDLQRGEAEWDGGNLYFDQWNYDFEWQLLPPVTDDGT
ncbi:transglutaminase domain-containing protein [Luteimonas sp. Sa2BVA3]|uniref:Transglutaminase domain-containing protein n=1 Tax=Luteimonas colneyensis TaxID=2762230 RepID=A0ABR8UJU0_9GAMM|nr:transglutaminase domain-containing protein [Luteimonas colneyensis]